MKLSIILIIFFAIVVLISTCQPIQDFIDRVDASWQLAMDDLDVWLENNQVKSKVIGVVATLILVVGVTTGLIAGR